MILQKQVEKFFFIKNTRNLLDFLFSQYPAKVSEIFTQQESMLIIREELNIVRKLNPTQQRIFKIKINQIEKFTIKKAYQDLASSLKIASILGYMLQDVFNDGLIEIEESDCFYNILQKILDIPQDSNDLFAVQASAEKQAKKYLESLRKLNYYI